jgi:replicative DNA helicase
MTNIIKKEDLALVVNEAAELGRKEFELRKVRVEVQHENLQRQIKELEGFKAFSIGTTDTRIESLKSQNREYIELAKKSSLFLNIDDFKGMVPLFPRNLIFIGTESGHGKSTLTANIACQFLRQNKKVLVVTNEEHPTDVLNRIICLIKGWAYYDHASITPDQQKVFDEMYPILSRNLEIIDDNYNGIGGITTTIEGIQTVMESLKASPNKFDIILVDYYQNINTSNKNPSAPSFDVLHWVGRAFDLFKMQYNAPIILLGQLKPIKDDDDSTPFKERIEGRKSIYNFSTCSIEARADKENSRTSWVFKKSRFAQSVGKTIVTGFEKGRYVKYDRDFTTRTRDAKLEKEMAELRKRDSAKINDIIKEGVYEKV